LRLPTRISSSATYRAPAQRARRNGRRDVVPNLAALNSGLWRLAIDFNLACAVIEVTWRLLSVLGLKRRRPLAVTHPMLCETMSLTNPLRPIDAADLATRQLPLALAALAFQPGLTLVCGDDERIARDLFAFLNSPLASSAHPFVRESRSVFWQDAIPRQTNETSGRAWLRAQEHRHPLWNCALAMDLVEALNLQMHMVKPLYMYSLGSARKLHLVAALACGVRLTCLDTPFAALDGPSRAVIAEFLTEAAEHPERGWLIFDFDKPAALAGARFAQIVAF